jgi:hypothetical protein
MANKQSGEVALTVDGREFVLRATHGTMANAEEILGRSIFDINGGGVRFVRALLLTMVKGQHGVRTLDDVDALLDADPLEVTKAVNEATSLFFLRYQPKNGQAPAL